MSVDERLALAEAASRYNLARAADAEARAEAAERECAELNDALDAMRMTADEVQSRQRGRVQAGAWAQAAAAVHQASRVCSSVAPSLLTTAAGAPSTLCARPEGHEGWHSNDEKDHPLSMRWTPREESA